MAAKYCQVNIKTTWLSSLVTSWFHVFWGGGSFPTAQIQQSYQAICPQVYAVSIFSLLMPLFYPSHSVKWNTPGLQGSFRSTGCLQPSSWLGFSLRTPAWKKPLSSLNFPLLSSNIHFCLCQSCLKLFLFLPHLSREQTPHPLLQGGQGQNKKQNDFWLFLFKSQRPTGRIEF